jgi:hypothetical protein
VEGRITPSAAVTLPIASARRVDPLAIAALLDAPPSAERDRALLAQVALIGPVQPARPVGFAALAAAAEPVPERGAQQDSGILA